ncbi:MAG TPA: transporter [Bryobacteraceae bacterium]|jgi:hypothetical protein|nr:transporter [Bryobacteraceae bacterium]
MIPLAGRMFRLAPSIAVCALIFAIRAQAQNRGVYPLGMSATNSGLLPAPGLTYGNQLLFFSRDHAKDDVGNTLPVQGQNYVLMDMNTFTWVSNVKLLGDGVFAAAATLPFAKNSLTSNDTGYISGGAGFADSYYLPFILGWTRKRLAIRAIYGFLAPTGRYVAGGNSNVGSGYWTHTVSSGQTFYLDAGRRFILSTFEMYEFHTTQEGTGIHPGDTFDLDYSLVRAFPLSSTVHLQIGAAGYEARQTTAKTGPDVSLAATQERYSVNSLGFLVNAAFPKHKTSLGLRYFKEFHDRSTFQGYSVQLYGSISF